MAVDKVNAALHWRTFVMVQPLFHLVNIVAERLLRKNWKIVFTESCTGGLISARLSSVPGISHVHCGSAVVYRNKTKAKWLGIPEAILDDPGPVSELVARSMVEGVLKCTPEAQIALAVTGHLGPDAPESQDGQVYVAIGFRGEVINVTQQRLPKFDPGRSPVLFTGDTEREQRQWAAAEFALIQLDLALQSKEVNQSGEGFGAGTGGTPC